MGSSLIVRAEGGNREKAKSRATSNPWRGVRTLDECSAILGVTRERVRQIELRALAKLRAGVLADRELLQAVIDMDLIDEREAPYAAHVEPIAEEPPKPKRRCVVIDPRIPGRQVSAPVVEAAPRAEQEAWLREVLAGCRACVRRAVEVLYFEGRSQNQAAVLLGVPSWKVLRFVRSALRSIRLLPVKKGKHPQIVAELEALLSDPPHASSRPFRPDAVVRSVVQAKVGTTTGVELPVATPKLSESPAAASSEIISTLTAQPSTVECSQLSFNESSNPPSWAAMESSAKAATWADTLTKPERDVLNLVLQGVENKQIAALLDCSLRTVEARRAALMRKAGVPNAIALAVVCTKLGLVA